MGFGNAFQDSLRAANMEARARLPEANVVEATRKVIREGKGGETLGLGSSEERAGIRRGFIEKARPLDRLTSTSRKFGDSLGFR